MTAEDIVVRPFTRSDRDQLVDLVDVHLAAVVPGMSIPVQAMLASLEREPGEFIVDRWVAERRTLVADQRDRIVAAAHLLRYDDRPDVNDCYRGAGEMKWLLCYPDAPYWPDSEAAGLLLAQSCLAQLARWRASRVYGDGTLPRPGVYGVPEVWPHVLRIYGQIGLTGGSTETVWIARVADLTFDSTANLDIVRTLGVNGTRFTTTRGGSEIGYLEVDVIADTVLRHTSGSGWADIGNLWVDPDHRRHGVGHELLAAAADWLDLAGVRRLLAYSIPDDFEEAGFLEASGFRVLTRTRRGLELTRR